MIKNTYCSIAFIVSFFLLIAVSIPDLHAQEKAKSKDDKKEIFIDTLDNKFDFSRFLIETKGFLPVPMIITEPALGGFGGVLGLAFLTPKKVPAGMGYVAPDITIGLGVYTANNSWAALGGQIGSIPKAGIKYRGFGGYANINMSFYRTLPSLGEKEFTFNIQAMPVYVLFSKSIPGTDVYLGTEYMFSKMKVEPLLEGGLPDWVPAQDTDSKFGSLGFFVEWDKRDNFFTADKGVKINVLFKVDDNWTGSDYTYQRLSGLFNWFIPVKPNWISGLRLEAQHVYDDPPFYLLPSISLRGVPLARYQGATTVLTETEQRFDFNRRWSMVAFAGVGKAIERDEKFGDAETVYNYGTGFRYLVARAFGIRAGIDVARGPDNFAWYITVGHNWNR